MPSSVKLSHAPPKPEPLNPTPEPCATDRKLEIQPLSLLVPNEASELKFGLGSLFPIVVEIPSGPKPRILKH